MEAGDEAFASALKAAPDYDPEVFAGFVRHNRVEHWLAPLVDAPSLAPLLSRAMVEKLLRLRAEQPQHTARLVRDSLEIRDLLADAAVEALFLKGLYLGQRFYGDAKRRHQYDIDALVRPADFERAVGALRASGWTLRRTEHFDRILRGPRDAHHAVSLDRAGSELDLHWSLRNRALERVDENPVWRRRQRFQLDGADAPALDTLSDDDMLAYLVTSIGMDLRRGGLRAKHLLDLHRMLLDLAPDWEGYFEARDLEGLLALHVDVLAVFTRLWCAREEHASLVAALDRRAALRSVTNDAAALALVTRKRNAPENRAWFARLYRPPRWSRWLARKPRLQEAGLPRGLAELLAREGYAATRTEDITPRPGGASPRRSYRITLADGRLLKGRRLRGAEAEERMQRWIPRLPQEHFPALLATGFGASLEAWEPGRTAPDRMEAAAGSVLGSVHRVLSQEPLGPGDERIRGLVGDVERGVRALRLARRLPAATAERVLAGARKGAPGAATWGLAHGDFCLDNLVAGGRGPVCVDNETVSPGILEIDLAQTFYRWPMSQQGRSSFLDGYGKLASAAGFLADEGFWMLYAALRAAELRLRNGIGGLAEPLAVLARSV